MSVFFKYKLQFGLVRKSQQSGRTDGQRDNSLFLPVKQNMFFDMIESYAKEYKLEVDQKTLHAEALEWSMTRGSRSGRVAYQFIQDLAGRLGKNID